LPNKKWTLIATILGSSIVFLDSSVLPLALPAIGQEPRLFVDVLEAQNYIHFGYLLTLSSLLILAGALTDYFGRRRVFIIGLIGFGATSLLCGLAPNLETLILFRLLQGAAGAVLVPGSLAILTTTFEGEEQGRAFGLWTAATTGVTILGPFLGGILVQDVSWRAIFLLNLPLVVIAVWAARRYMAESRDEAAAGQFDWLGAVLVALAVGGLAFGAIYGEQRQWSDPLAFVAIGVGALTTLALPFYFARVAHPLVPLEMFRSRNFTVTNISTLLIYGALYGTFLYVPIYFLGTLGYSATGMGLAFIPTSLFMVFLSARFGALAARLGPRRFMAAGPVLMGLGILWLARIPATSQPWRLALGEPATYLPPADYFVDVLPALVVFGIGLSIMVAPLVTALMRSVPGRQAALASAINNAISRVGPQLAGAIIFVVVTSTFYGVLQQLVPGVDVNNPRVRAQIAPLNPVPADLPPGLAEAGRAAPLASAEALHMAIIVNALLLVAGGVVNAIGIDDREARSEAAAAPPH
jgi:EmrB/QacA subfamily drug resistance transporter